MTEIHRGLLDEIIQICALGFIEYEKDVQQNEEEDSNNDASELSYYEEKE